MLYVDPVSQNHMAVAERGAASTERKKQALEEYERLFLFQMIKAMRISVLKSELFDGESQREMFQEMLDDVWAGEMAKSGQLGVSKLMEEQLQLQESQATLTAERRAARAAADFQGLPLQPPPSVGISLTPPRPEGLPLKQVGTEFLESPRQSKGIPLGAQDLLSESTPLPIKSIAGSAAYRPGAGGITP